LQRPYEKAKALRTSDRNPNMTNVILAIHLVVALMLIGVVMLQRSEGGALGIGGGSGNLFSSRGVASGLTRATAILAACFFATSIALTMLSNNRTGGSLVDQAPAQTENAPAPAGSLLPKIDPNKPVVPTN
jgi:preprotein translocase subunit SecG